MTITRFLTTAGTYYSKTTQTTYNFTHLTLPLTLETTVTHLTPLTHCYSTGPKNEARKVSPNFTLKNNGFLNVLSTSSAVSKSPGVVSKEGNKKIEDWNDILNRWYGQYQDFVGITALKNAQDKVTELSDGLLSAQGERRRLQAEIEELQARLVENHHHITKTEQYSQEHMRLFSEARELNDKLREVRSNFSQYEQTERDTFTQLSAAIRDCHEQERMQAEQGKYWSIIASVVSAALASIITSVNNWVRIKEIKEHVTTSQQALLQGYQQMRTDILTSLNSESSQGHTVASPATLSTGEDARDVNLPVDVNKSAVVDVKDGLGKDLDQVGKLTPAEVGKLASVLTRFSETGEGLVNDAAKVTKVIDELMRVSKDVAEISQTTEILKETSTRISDDFSSATDKLIQQLTATLVDVTGTGRQRDGLIILPSSTESGGGGGGDVSYPKVASSMIFGAAFGTLITAFFLGAIGGSGG